MTCTGDGAHTAVLLLAELPREQTEATAGVTEAGQHLGLGAPVASRRRRRWMVHATSPLLHVKLTWDDMMRCAEDGIE